VYGLVLKAIELSAHVPEHVRDKNSYTFGVSDPSLPHHCTAFMPSMSNVEAVFGHSFSNPVEDEPQNGGKKGV